MAPRRQRPTRALPPGDVHGFHLARVGEIGEGVEDGGAVADAPVVGEVDAVATP